MGFGADPETQVAEVTVTVPPTLDPPGNLPDLSCINGARQAWSDAVSGWFNESIDRVQKQLAFGDSCQYFNPLKTGVTGPLIEQTVVWNAMSGTLRARHGRRRALQLAEQLRPLSERADRPGPYFGGGQWESLFYRPQDEYCEWRTFRNPHGKIEKVVFTSEPPEYWQALHGDDLPDLDRNPKYRSIGDCDLLLYLYHKHVSPEVKYEDLICPEDLIDTAAPNGPKVVYQKGSYNPYNRWNTRDGIMHLCQPDNSLSAEIQLGADATVLRERDGRMVTDPNELMCCAGYGGPMRTSDPTIGSSVNNLAAQGCRLTLRNPVGLYIHHLDLAGFADAHGRPVPPDYFTVTRGSEGMIERAEFKVPPGEPGTVSDLTIGGVPITLGSQIAEHITVSLVAQAWQPGTVENNPVECSHRCHQDDANGDVVFLREIGLPGPPLTTPAFQESVPPS